MKQLLHPSHRLTYLSQNKLKGKPLVSQLLVKGVGAKGLAKRTPPLKQLYDNAVTAETTLTLLALSTNLQYTPMQWWWLTTRRFTFTRSS